MTRRKLPLWTLLGVAAAAALLIGGGALSSPAPTASQRAYAIESVIRCPSCEDLSVANSSAPTAVTVRATVRQLVDKGLSDQQITGYLVARYGSSIVLDPPASGWSLLVWLVPLLGGAAAMIMLGVVLVRRRNATEEDPVGVGVVASISLDREALEERKEFLLRSLADADAEYLAGDLSDRDYLALRHRDMVRLEAVEAQVRQGSVAVASGVMVRPAPCAGGEPGAVLDGQAVGDEAVGDGPGPRRRGRRRRSWWYLGGAVAAFGSALVLAVTLFATDRMPGQTATGNVAAGPTQQIAQTLSQAATYENEGQLGQAAQLYQSVLDRSPDDEVALAQLGWLEYQTGQQGSSASLISDARAKLDRAVQLDPVDYAVRLYLGTVLLRQDGNAAGAVAEYRQFLADNPPASLVTQSAAELRAAYQRAGLPLPSQVPAA